jgi:hypothetical protein
VRSRANARRREVCQHRSGEVEVLVHIGVQRLEAVPVLPGRFDIPLPQQQREAGDVAAQLRQFGSGSAEGRSAGSAISRCNDGRCAVDQALEVGVAR